VIFCCSWRNKLFMLASNRTSDDLLNNIFKKIFFEGGNDCYFLYMKRK
jgi:hypothetical protein